MSVPAVVYDAEEEAEPMRMENLQMELSLPLVLSLRRNPSNRKSRRK